MTEWDEIYKEYQKSGKEWATLAEGIHPLLRQFLRKSEFKLKYVFDIGCGTGKYLKLFKKFGFKTDGIDSSDTAVKMTKKSLGKGPLIICANMFEFEIPKDKYDLIVSVSAIHHGTKGEVQKLVNKIHDAIAKNGRIFITVPDLAEGKKGITSESHKEISEGTFVPLYGPEKGLPHSFYTKEEAKELFSRFKGLELDLDSYGRWVVRGSKSNRLLYSLY